VCVLCVCVCVCVYACVRVCVCVWICVRVCVWERERTHGKTPCSALWSYSFLSMCVRVCECICVNVCVCVSVCVCAYVCMHASICVCVCLNIVYEIATTFRTFLIWRVLAHIYVYIHINSDSCTLGTCQNGHQELYEWTVWSNLS